ncbi:hypothetical protein [Paenibacillus andongensis]|uniref:hypothetical protein n=1 Tax=Paenibacillus andongensis TaxID=2975482 RepID=UPI0021BB4ACC|nr:hypothetical protein [Paenibacillus andongensis]
MVTSFNVWGTRIPHIGIHGTTGSFIVPDPNHFGGTTGFDAIVFLLLSNKRRSGYDEFIGRFAC